MAIYTELMEHQKVMVKFALGKDYVGLFAEYGVGKSLVALAYIDKLKIHKTLIVSTKLSIQSTWPIEIKKHTNLKYVSLIGSKSQKLASLFYGIRISNMEDGHYHKGYKTPIIYLINYEGIKNIITDLVAIKFDLIVLDESTKIKSHKTQRTKLLWALGATIKKKIIMTGFPITEALYDVYSQIKFLDNGKTFGKSYYKFVDDYFTKVGMKYVAKRKAIKQLLIKIKPFCIRITNANLKLPPKTYKKIILEPTYQQAKALKELNENFQLALGKVNIDTQYIFALIAKSLQICDGFVQDEKYLETITTKKDAALLDLLDEIDIVKNKVLIWCSFRYSVLKIFKYLSSTGHNILTLTGSTPDVNLVVNKFQNSKKHNVLIATQKKAATSITLTNCRYAIYYSNMWSYDDRYNSEARIYRKGSEKHSNIVYTDFVTKGTIEEKVLLCLQTKKNLVEMLKKEFLSL